MATKQQNEEIWSNATKAMAVRQRGASTFDSLQMKSTEPSRPKTEPLREGQNDPISPLHSALRYPSPQMLRTLTRLSSATSAQSAVSSSAVSAGCQPGRMSFAVFAGGCSSSSVSISTATAGCWGALMPTASGRG